MSSTTVLLPVQAATRCRSRLADLPDERRTALTTALALDTASAALATPLVQAVLAVTDDVAVARALAALGCAVMPDGSDDLNESLQQAAAEARRRWPDCTVAALCADLPALQPDELTAALSAVPDGGTAYVSDHTGAGTTLYAAAPGAAFVPEFGFRSAELHADAGAIDIPGALPGLRLDVDETGDIAHALVLGVGPHTTAATTD